MTSILVGVDGSPRGQKAVEWAARRAYRTNARLTLATAIGMGAASAFGADTATVRETVEKALAALRDDIAARFAGVSVDTAIHDGGIIEALVEISGGYDMVVLGSHHEGTLAEAFGGTKGMRVSISAEIPTVVVPEDWEPESGAEGIVVGVAADDVDEGAISFAVREALAVGQPLELVAVWGLPSLISRPAEALGGGLEPVGDQFQRKLDAHVQAIKAAHPELEVSGHALEGSSPSHVLLDSRGTCRLLVLGTHARSSIARAFFGSVTHSVLLHVKVPTVVVPKP